ncbi:RNA polymerase sigma factor [Sphingomonas sp. A2-49]|jgi:RNA polymerase sigma factor (sigma-70 family)|uniref:RNA polymerase sigma factor n=1 Tax=Sphingomonas sp. A2-49 TaxID=1391375 RepID=UPI0021CF0FB6|nr:RNA polymerase sigma factor [Sphingomonas sp. A2-49]MCU6453404.1 RNA polymerase sigma factor [Sphingomonas sp. A2-49]
MRSVEAQPPTSGLSQLLGELRPELLRFLIARLGDAGEAEDLLQELWIRTRDGAGGPVANGRAYLYRAAQNLVLDRARERRRRTARDGEWSKAQSGSISGTEPADPRANAEDVLLEREKAGALATAIAALPEAAGRAFRMHKLDGLPHAEVARRLGITRSGVEKHIALAMAHLRRALAD